MPNILSSKYKNIIYILYLQVCLFVFIGQSEFFLIWFIFHLGEHYPI